MPLNLIVVNDEDEGCFRHRWYEDNQSRRGPLTTLLDDELYVVVDDPATSNAPSSVIHVYRVETFDRRGAKLTLRRDRTVRPSKTMKISWLSPGHRGHLHAFEVDDQSVCSLVVVDRYSGCISKKIPQNYHPLDVSQDSFLLYTRFLGFDANTVVYLPRNRGAALTAEVIGKWKDLPVLEALRRLTTLVDLNESVEDADGCVLALDRCGRLRLYDVDLDRSRDYGRLLPMATTDARLFLDRRRGLLYVVHIDVDDANDPPSRMLMKVFGLFDE